MEKARVRKIVRHKTGAEAGKAAIDMPIKGKGFVASEPFKPPYTSNSDIIEEAVKRDIISIFKHKDGSTTAIPSLICHLHMEKLLESKENRFLLRESMKLLGNDTWRSIAEGMCQFGMKKQKIRLGKSL